MKTRIIIISLIIMNIFLFFKMSSINIYSRNNNESSSYIYPYKQSLLLNGAKLNDCKIIDLKSVENKLSNIIEDKKGLILLYDKMSCNACIDSLVSNINDISSTVDSNSVIIAIAYSASKEYMIRFARINKMKFPIYLDKTECLVRKLKIGIFPTVIVFNENSEIINSFSLNQNNKELNLTFFRSLNRFLNDK